MGRKPTNDPNLFAKLVFDGLLNKLDPEAAAGAVELDSASQADPKAQAAGRLGGLKGGQARAKKLSPGRRKAIARKAAKIYANPEPDTRYQPAERVGCKKLVVYGPDVDPGFSVPHRTP